MYKNNLNVISDCLMNTLCHMNFVLSIYYRMLLLLLLPWQHNEKSDLFLFFYNMCLFIYITLILDLGILHTFYHWTCTFFYFCLHNQRAIVSKMLCWLSPKHTMFKHNPISLLGSGFNGTLGIKELSICVLAGFFFWEVMTAKSAWSNLLLYKSLHGSTFIWTN